jgi:Uma2 family endonuclease
MSTATAHPIVGQGEQSLTLDRIGWNQYQTIADALPDRGDLRIIYIDGRLTLVTTSRRHDWFAERLGDLVEAIANGLDIPWDDAGTATFRREDAGAGVEGDKTFYFGPNAERMQGPQDIDLSTQPPPDLAIEVEVSHSADQSLMVWGRLGVPEVWRFDPGRERLSFWRRRADGGYEAVDRSLVLPSVEPADILGQIRLVAELGNLRWHGQLADWVRDVLVPRGR